MSSVYASGYKEVMEKYNVNSSVSLLGVSLFCIGLALGKSVLSCEAARHTSFGGCHPLTKVDSIDLGTNHSWLFDGLTGIQVQ
jgi:hypothetical protein